MANDKAKEGKQHQDISGGNLFASYFRLVALIVFPLF